MEKLLPYYERELGMLRRAGQEFAARYPKLAGSLQISGETCTDPHVERLIQATAFLNARVARLLDDGYSGFTEALLGMLYPHYLRPFPSCSVARIDYSRARASELSTIMQLPRGSEMKTHSHNGVACCFRTAYDVTVAPIVISALQFDPIIQAPAALRLPRQAVSAIRITIETTTGASLPALELPTLRAFIDGEAALTCGLRDALFMHTACAFIEIDGQWRMLEKPPISAAGFADCDALLPTAPSEHAAYRLLSEYFSFPEKFDFIDIDLAALLACAPARCSSVTLTLGLAEVRPDSSSARILRMLTPDNLVLSCTPIINLFSHTATPIRITHTQSSYPLIPGDMPAIASDIYSVDAVQLLRKTDTGGSAITGFRPYYSLRHGEADSRQGRYWLVRRDEELDAGGTGHGHSLSLVDRDFNPLELDTGVTSIDLTCTNRNYPHLLHHGQPAGDLNTEAVIGHFPIRLLRRPTTTHRIHSEGGAHWGLIAHLALNHRCLTQEGLPALAAMLRLYAQPDSTVAQRQIDGICALEHHPTAAWLHQREGAAYLRGIEVQVTLDEEAYAGTGIHVFAQLLDYLFALHVHLNSFTQLVVLSKANGKELLRCPPRNGSLALA